MKYVVVYGGYKITADKPFALYIGKGFVKPHPIQQSARFNRLRIEVQR